MKPPNKTTHQTLYSCPDSVVQVIAKSEGLNRSPQHNYKCMLFILNPDPSSRVRRLPNGAIEFMPNYDELRAMLKGMDPEIEAKLPESFRNKPRERQLRFQAYNKARQPWQKRAR